MAYCVEFCIGFDVDNTKPETDLSEVLAFKKNVASVDAALSILLTLIKAWVPVTCSTNIWRYSQVYTS